MESISEIRQQFPILERTVNDRPLVYFDNAATSQKPYPVIKAVSEFYAQHNANINRGAHGLGGEASGMYASARGRVADFIGAAKSEEIVFTRSTTEAINLVAYAFALPRLEKGKEILVTEAAHHANFVPWQRVCDMTGATLRVLPMNEDGTLAIDELGTYLSQDTVLFAVSHVSNTLGTIRPIEILVAAAKQVDVPVLVDGAQAVPHMPIDVQRIDCDFYAFSGHKMYAPTGIGCLYGRRSVLGEMAPFQTGGGMVTSVSAEKTEFQEPPRKFEAGTPHISGAVGLQAAIDYMESIGIQEIHERELELANYLADSLESVSGLGVFAGDYVTPIRSFAIEGMHPHDLGTLLDEQGVAVRSGRHCTDPIMRFFDVPAMTRVSLAFYNTKEEIDVLVEGIEKAKETFGV